MAIYHLNASVISRSAGRSVTAAAAYRAAEKIYDERTGQTFDYTRKNGVDATIILAKENAPNWVSSRARLWNEVEKVEKRKDSQLAREIDLAIPVELDNFQKQKLVKEFVLEQFVELGMVADVAFHHLDSHNPHAHILLTMREISTKGFGQKNRSWNATELLKEQRQAWEIHANRALEQAEHPERIDCRTLEEQGINRIPQIHKGADVAAMMDKGIPTERGEEYLSICVANQEIEALERQLAATEEAIALSEPQLSIQTAQTTTFSQLNRALGSEEELATELSDERSEREATEWREGLDQVIDSLTNSNQRAEELGERLRKPNRKARDLELDATGASEQTAVNGKDDRNPDINAERPTFSHTEPNRTAEDLAREFQRLEERARSSDSKNRKNRKSVGASFRELTAQFGEKIQQFARNLFADSEDVEQRQVQGTELVGGGDNNQTPRIAQGELGAPTVREPSNLGIQPNISSQQQNPERDQRQGQQYRDSYQSAGEEIRIVNTTQSQSERERPLDPEWLSFSEGQQGIAANRLTLLRIATDNNRWRSSWGLPLQDTCVLTLDKYRISYQTSNDNLTLFADDGRGEILSAKLGITSLEIERTNLIRADLDFLASLGTLDKPIVGDLSLEDAKVLYQKFKGNEAYGYATQWAQADRIAVQNALAAGLTNEQAIRIVARSQRAFAIRNEYGTDQAIEYIIERINEVTGKPFSPVETASTAKRLYDTYKEGTSAFTESGLDSFIARSAIADGWTPQDLQAILAQSQIAQKLSQQQKHQTAFNYTSKIVKEAQKWYQSSRLAIPTPPTPAIFSQQPDSSEIGELAIQVYRLSVQFFNQLAKNQLLEQTPEGIWQFLGQIRTLEYDPNKRRFSIYHQERGEIMSVKLERQPVIEIASMQPDDLEIFQQAHQQLERINQQQSVERTQQRSRGISR